MPVHSPVLKSKHSHKAVSKLIWHTYFEIDQGYDFLAVKQESQKVISLVRNKRIPVFLKVNTARYKEHVGPGEDFTAGYRSEGEMDKWKALDPLITDRALFEEFAEKINNEIEDAVQFGINSPYPTREDLFADV